MDTTLIVCAQEKAVEALKKLTKDTPYRDCTVAGSAAQTRRMMSGDLYPLIIVNAPLPDETGIDLASEIAATTSAAVILLVKAELVPLVGDAAAEAGVLLVSKPLSPQLFDQALRLAISCRNRLALLKNENQRLQKRLEEQKIVDRAKCLLIEHMRLTEDDAHRLIEKQAMDQRAPRLRIAQKILDQFEL